MEIADPATQITMLRSVLLLVVALAVASAQSWDLNREPFAEGVECVRRRGQRGRRAAITIRVLDPLLSRRPAGDVAPCGPFLCRRLV